MYDEPRNPHRLRFDSTRKKQKTKLKSQFQFQTCARKSKIKGSTPKVQLNYSSEERVLSPPTGYSGK